VGRCKQKQRATWKHDDDEYTIQLEGLNPGQYGMAAALSSRESKHEVLQQVIQGIKT
jgi:hypothetical protein